MVEDVPAPAPHDGNKDPKPSLEDLEREIQEARALLNPKETPKSGLDAMRVGLEMVVSTLVGAFLGYHLDRWLGTLPVFFIIFLFLGVAAGVLTIYKQASKLEREEGES
ncbi:MAG: AtpZ/AtpI family protein [Hyphomicrobiales bacterium]|nr:AtpZ/AtpI family protein [Rickettsiales bacterium]MCP5362125.1 AtpZ/AtpI family protein [Hyphomicrobiales bacterium]